MSIHFKKQGNYVKFIMINVLAPPKPHATSFENILLVENNKNGYQNALLNMQLAAEKANKQEQKSLLIESFGNFIS